MISESGMTEHLVQSYWCTCLYMDVHSQLQVLIYTTQIYVSDQTEWPQKAYVPIQSTDFSGCRNCKNMSHFHNLKLHIHEFRLQTLKKKKLSATILTLKPMCRLCTLYSPTKRILQMKSKLFLKSGKPVMCGFNFIHNVRSWWMLEGTLVHNTNTVVKSAKFVNHSWIMGAHQKLRLEQSTGVPIRVWQGIFPKKELRYKRAQFSDFSSLVLSNYFIR